MTASGARLPPSGESFEIAAGPHRTVVTEVGATLRAYTVDGVDVVDGFGPDESSTAGRGQVLAPWPNRLEDGRYAFEGVEGRAALDEPERGNAIHGLVRWLPWSVTSREDDHVTLSCTLSPQPAYPWRLALSIRYAVGDDGLTVTTVAANRSDAPAPFGIGFHPYLTVGTPVIDAARLTIPAGRHLIADERALPIDEAAVNDTPFDFRTSRTIGATALDTCFTALDRSTDGVAVTELGGPDGSTRVALWVDEAFPYLMVYTGHTLDPTERRRQGLAVEPMTCPPNAFRSGRDLARLTPGEEWTGTWGINPAP